MAKRKENFYNLLKGKFLVDKDATKVWSMLVFLAILALIMIGSSHSIDKKVQKIAVLNKQMRELRDEFVATRSELMKVKMESTIVAQLANNELYVAENPPKKIIVKN